MNHKDSPNDQLNKELEERIEKIYDKNPDMGYHRIRDSLEHDDNIRVNDKRILRICRKKKIRSNLKYQKMVAQSQRLILLIWLKYIKP